MTRVMKMMALMSSGALFYGGFEVIGRGYSHISMGLLGGIALCMIHFLNSNIKNNSTRILSNAAISAFFITACELLTGEILNRRIGMHIWDYSALPYNFDGQICLRFSVIWFVLSVFGILFDEVIKRCIFNEFDAEDLPEDIVGELHPL